MSRRTCQPKKSFVLGIALATVVVFANVQSTKAIDCWITVPDEGGFCIPDPFPPNTFSTCQCIGEMPGRFCSDYWGYAYNYYALITTECKSKSTQLACAERWSCVPVPESPDPCKEAAHCEPGVLQEVHKTPGFAIASGDCPDGDGIPCLPA